MCVFFSLFLSIFLSSQMIPTVEDCGTYSRKDDKTNRRQNDLNAQWLLHGTAACNTNNDANQVDRQFTSRTDKPRLAHEVYIQWIAIPSNVTCKLTQRLVLTPNDLLIAAYSGPSLMYRK